MGRPFSGPGQLFPLRMSNWSSSVPLSLNDFKPPELCELEQTGNKLNALFCCLENGDNNTTFAEGYCEKRGIRFCVQSLRGNRERL